MNLFNVIVMDFLVVLAHFQSVFPVWVLVFGVPHYVYHVCGNFDRDVLLPTGWTGIPSDSSLIGCAVLSFLLLSIRENCFTLITFSFSAC
jgi:hypothetical protein